MRNMLIVVAALAGCVGEDAPPQDPHEATECDETSWGYPYASCEAACVVKENDGGPWCHATFGAPGDAFLCGDNLTTFEGARGCCISPIAPDGIRRVHFAVCLD